MCEPVIISRKDAQASGLKRYFTGKPCAHGHTAERYVFNKACTSCLKMLAESRRDANREYSKAHHIKNRDAILARRRVPSDARKISNEIVGILASRGIAYGSPEYYTEYKREHYKQRSQLYRSRDRNRRAAIAKCAGKHSKADIDALYLAQSGRCVYCRCSLETGFHVDHIVAIKNGGANDISNLQITCGTCNRRKGAKDHIAFANQIGLLL